MSKISKINILGLMKFQDILFTLMGLLAGIIYSFGGLLIDILVSLDWITTDDTPGLSFGTILAFGALIGMPLIGAVIGFIVGFFEALLYNLFAKLIGGFEINLKNE